MLYIDDLWSWKEILNKRPTWWIFFNLKKKLANTGSNFKGSLMDHGTSNQCFSFWKNLPLWQLFKKSMPRVQRSSKEFFQKYAPKSPCFEEKKVWSHHICLVHSQKQSRILKTFLLSCLAHSSWWMITSPPTSKTWPKILFFKKPHF
jgi:hypothetical protein